MREHITINLNTIKKLPHILRWTANWTKPLWDTAAFVLLFTGNIPRGVLLARNEP